MPKLQYDLPEGHGQNVGDPDSNVGFWLDTAEEKSLRNGRVMHVQTNVDSKYFTSIRMQRKYLS